MAKSIIQVLIFALLLLILRVTAHAQYVSIITAHAFIIFADSAMMVQYKTACD